MFDRRHLVGALCLLMAALVPADAQTPVRSVAASLSQLVTGPEGYRVLPIGLTAGARGITALEPSLPVLATQPRVVIVGGLDGSPDGTRVVVDLVTWRLGDATIVRNRRRWQRMSIPSSTSPMEP